MVSNKDIDRILAKLNDFNQSFYFTHEIISLNSLPFLDTLVKVRDNFTFSFSIYREPTHSDRYLHFKSNHPLCHKISVIDSLVYWALTVCDEDLIDREFKHIKKYKT